MKRTLLVLLGIGLTPVFSQEIPVWQKTYVYADLGLTWMWEGPGLFLEGGAGFQQKTWLGGGAFVGYYWMPGMYNRNIQVYGIHYRAMPRRYCIQANVGYLRNWYYSNSGPAYYDYIGNFDVVGKLSIAWMPIPSFKIGMMGMVSSPLSIEVEYQGNNPTSFFYSESFWTIQPFVGLVLPGNWSRFKWRKNK